MNSERKVKGSAFIELVDLIRHFKDEPWEQYLTPADMEIVNSTLVPTEWYPVMFSDRLTIAVFKLIAKGDLGMVEQFAKATIEDYFKGPYRPFLDKGDPIQAIKKFIELRDSLYNFSDTSVEVTGEKGLRVRIFNLGQVGEGIDVFISFLSVQFKEMIALNGDKDIAVDSRLFDEKGQSIVEFDLSWS